MPQFSLVLPNIRSCHNVGAMFRTADVFGFEKLYLVGYTAQPPKPQIDKVSLGAEQWVSWEHAEDLEKLIRELQKDGTKVIALEKSEMSTDIRDFQIREEENIALVVGNEVTGVAPEIQQLCDGVVHIPMYGKKESLNVSIAAGVAMYILKHALG
ncbi:RNA methyltransferase [Candidatus Nomurabacteria bacterium]|nr:RNA methyltransferase [Candidatus Nomurabacteria bacterium]